MRRPAFNRFRPWLDQLDDRCLLTALMPSQLTGAYGLNSITFNANGQTFKGNGASQIMVFIEAYHDPYLVSDLHHFDQTFGVPDSLTGVVNLGNSTTDDGWSQEAAMDIEYAHTIAPAAGIIVVEAKSPSISDLLAAVNFARSIPRVGSISMSWGGTEFSGQTSLDSLFTTPAGHSGITFIASSGDEGPAGGAEWPASSANVLAVGGTSLQASSTGSYLGESLWSGSSGGFSSYASEPSYQYALQSTGQRMTPDVSFDADPNTGVYVYSTAPSTGQGSWSQVGGTSLGAPAWSGILAIANEGRMLAGKSSLDGATQTLPALYSLPSTDFHQVPGLFSGFFGFGSIVTAGLGSPNGAALISGLVAGNTTASTSINPFTFVRSQSTFTTAAANASGSQHQQPSGDAHTQFVASLESPGPIVSVPIPTITDAQPTLHRTRPASQASMWDSALEGFGQV